MEKWGKKLGSNKKKTKKNAGQKGGTVSQWYKVRRFSWCQTRRVSAAAVLRSLSICLTIRISKSFPGTTIYRFPNVELLLSSLNWLQTILASSVILLLFLKIINWVLLLLLCAIYHWQQCVCSGGPSISLFSFPLLLYFVIATHPFDVTAFRRYQHVVRQSFTSHSLWRWKQSHVTLWRVFKNCSFIAVVNWTPNGKKNQEKKDRCLFPTSESEARPRAVFPQDGNHAVFLHCSFRAVCLLSA